MNYYFVKNLLSMMFLALLCSTVSKRDTFFLLFLASLPWGTCGAIFKRTSQFSSFSLCSYHIQTEFGSRFHFNSHSLKTSCADSDGAGRGDEEDKDPAHREPTEL